MSLETRKPFLADIDGRLVPSYFAEEVDAVIATLRFELKLMTDSRNSWKRIAEEFGKSDDAQKRLTA